MNDVHVKVIEALVEIANEKLRDGVRLVYFGRDTESGSARIYRYGPGDDTMVAVGSPRECWQYLRGTVQALDIAGW